MSGLFILTSFWFGNVVSPVKTPKNRKFIFKNHHSAPDNETEKKMYLVLDLKRFSAEKKTPVYTRYLINLQFEFEWLINERTGARASSAHAKHVQLAVLFDIYIFICCNLFFCFFFSLNL